MCTILTRFGDYISHYLSALPVEIVLKSAIIYLPDQYNPTRKMKNISLPTVSLDVGRTTAAADAGE